MKYSYHPYHSYFISRAQDEIKRLKELLPKERIEHFGSTAIPGVGGKGIIDIYVITARKNLKQASSKIQTLGYEFRPTGGIPGERIFHQRTAKYPDGHKQLFHVHLTYFENYDWKESQGFRDFLRNHPDLAHEYSQIKHQAVLAAKSFHIKSDKKRAYMEAKKPVIEKIRRAMKNNELR